MKNLIALTLTVILVASWSEPAKAQQDMPNIYCGDCRGPRMHPRDYRNFAYNQVFGPEGWMSYDQADIFRITNANGRSIIVDMNLDLQFFTLELGIPIPLPYPTAVVVQIILIFPNGDQKVYNVDPRAHSGGLPVGGTSGGSGTGGPGDGGGAPPPPLPSPTPDTGDERCGTSQVDGDRRRRTCM